ncbi:cystathionine gamma-lyase cys3, partial [Massospora cicadina]
QMVYNSDKSLGFATQLIHASQSPDASSGAVIPPISLSTTFKQSAAGVHQGYEYSRSGNPNRQQFENAVATLEKGDYGLAFASGSAATASIVNTLPSGSHIVSVNDVYGGTYRYFTKVASTKGITVDFIDMKDPQTLESAMKPNTKLVWAETPTNPTLRLVNIKAVAEITHRHGARLVIDNTFLSPYFQNPITQGADIVVHSVTKYINGHSDVVMGVAVTNDAELYDDLKFQQNAYGAVPSPFDCFLAHRGLKTLALRMRQHGSNALAVARYLERSPRVDKVIYPGLASHPQHELAKAQQSGFGGMVSFRIKGDGETADRFLQALNIFTLAESLGGIESLCELPAKMTHGSIPANEREELGITDNLIRLSVGIEDVKDLVDDLEQALASATPKSG